MSLETLNVELLTCKKCPRLVEWRETVARLKRRAYLDQDYWGKPVPGFGDPHARVFVVGLAPGAHGSNRTGRQFTGDASGDFLYPALYRAGFASQPNSISRMDGLTLTDLYTAPVCRCVPPDNKPTPQEMANCQTYMIRELKIIQPRIMVALGRIAFDAILRLVSLPQANFAFSHGALHSISVENQSAEYIVCSYHPSRQNTQTGRLSEAMFDRIWKDVRGILES
jgi:uracil-DNA glycosylase